MKYFTLLNSLALWCVIVFNFNTLFAQSPILISAIPERCVNGDTLKLNDYVTPLGGSWSSSSSGLIQPDKFIPSIAGAGQHWVYYIYTDTWGTYKDSSIITINALPIVTANTKSGVTTFCRTEGLMELNGQPSGSGGVWTGQGVQGNYFNTLISPNVDKSYTLNYEYTDVNGCKNNENLTITLRPEPYVRIDPTADVLCYGNPYSIRASYENADGVLWYLEDFKADGNFIGSVTNTIVTYNPGLGDLARLSFWLAVKTTHTDSVCPSATDSIKIAMSDMPKPEFYADPSEGCTPLAVKFNNLSTIGLGNIDEFYWNFGDGGESEIQNPKHKYIHSGTYTVILTVTSDAGCENILGKVDYIRAHVVPDVNFLAHPEIIPLSQPILSIENLTRFETIGTEYTWNFGDHRAIDGGTSTLREPIYKYSDTGHYEVKLKAINEFGCEDSFTKTLVVKPGFFYTTIIVFPNPVKNQTTILNTGASRINSVLLINSLGEVVRSYSNTNKYRLIISRDGLHNGIYFLKVKPEYGNEVYRKVIFY